jgi:hypothetical protein
MSNIIVETGKLITMLFTYDEKAFEVALWVLGITAFFMAASLVWDCMSFILRKIFG